MGKSRTTSPEHTERRGTVGKAPYSDEPAPGALAEFDVLLAATIARAQRGPHCPFLGLQLEVFYLAPAIRRRWSAIACELIDISDIPPARWHRLCAELHQLCSRARRPPFLADAFILDGDEWRARYDPPGKAA